MFVLTARSRLKTLKASPQRVLYSRIEADFKMKKGFVDKRTPVTAKDRILSEQIECPRHHPTCAVFRGDQVQYLWHFSENRLKELLVQITSPPDVFIHGGEIKFVGKQRIFGVELASGPGLDGESAFHNNPALPTNISTSFCTQTAQKFLKISNSIVMKLILNAESLGPA